MHHLISFSFILILGIQTLPAQWISINPGAGGQVQDVVCDPDIPGRLFLACDMVGIFETIDNGESWNPKGSLHQNRVYAIAITPGNSGRMYVGNLYGLEVSNDGGNTFASVPETRKLSIAAIAIDPNNQNNVIAAIGWRDDYDFAGMFGMSINGKGEIFRSTDGGVSWTRITFDETSNTDRNVFTIVYDKNNSDIIYLGAAKGIYKSTNGGLNWTKIQGPSDTFKNRGVSLSPDGKVLYASYLSSWVGLNARVYTTLTSSIDWKEVNKGATGIDIGNIRHWYPEVDPRSMGSSHKVLISQEGDRVGLYEGTFDWNYNSNTVAFSWAQIWTSTEIYDLGWDVGRANARYVHYTPVKWERALWTTTNQTIQSADWNESAYLWKNRYSNPNTKFSFNIWGRTVPAYSSNGTASTYTWDVAAHENYIIQGQGDNGPMESWDSGFSWSNVWMKENNFLSDVQAVAIVEAGGPPIVLAQMTQGFGGAAYTGNLYAKKLVNHAPSDTWQFIGGGESKKGGLGNGVLSDIASSPAKPERVFIFSRQDGMYMIDDINDAFSGGSNVFIKISNGVANNIYSSKQIAPHPTNPNIVFFSSNNGGNQANQGVYKGEWTGPGAQDWTWTYIYNGRGWDAEVACWEHNGQVYLFYSGASNETGGDGNHYIGALSLDEGNTWNVVLNRQKAKQLTTHSWFSVLEADYNFQNKGGVYGYGNYVFMNLYDHRFQKGYGLYRGIIDENGDVSWEDWTGDLPFVGLTSLVTAMDNGKLYMYAATPGAGVWKRELTSAQQDVIPTSVSITGCPGMNLTIDDQITLSANVMPLNATSKAVTWSSSHPEVASVNAEGVVKALSKGATTIIAKTTGGNRIATCTFNVNDGTTSVPENEKTQSFKIFPNPSKGEFNISFDTFSQKIDVTVVNILGRIVTQKLFNDTDRVKIDMSGLPDGLYLVLVEYDNKLSARSLILKDQR
jgi:hypothetical protein